MRASERRTTIYLVCFHSEKPKPKSLDRTKGQFRKVEDAIDKNEWPYDNGDDPSFYVARKGGRLTWGVCRQDLRNPIERGDIVVFFSYTSLSDNDILYRLCAVATVDDKVDHRAIYTDPRLVEFRDSYINRLIIPDNGGWRYDESDRPKSGRHKNWIWRIAVHPHSGRDAFIDRHNRAYPQGSFSDSAADSGEFKLARNYILFSDQSDHTFISPYPPKVATAVKGQNECWSHEALRALTVGKAGALRADRRDYLRTAGGAGGYVHRQLRFEMPADCADKWREELIEELKRGTGPKKLRTGWVPKPGTARC